MKAAARNRKHGRCTVLNICLNFRLRLNETNEGFCRRGSGRSFHADGPKTEKAREPTVESLVRGIWILWESEAERTVREGV